jgi:hypothetical protein
VTLGAHPPLDEATEGWCWEYLPTTLIANLEWRDGDPMPDLTQRDPDSIWVALGHGGMVEVDGDTVVLGDEKSPSVVLRLTRWRARSPGCCRSGRPCRGFSTRRVGHT